MIKLTYRFLIAGLVMALMSSCYSTDVASGAILQKRKYIDGFFVSRHKTFKDRSEELKTEKIIQVKDEVVLAPEQKVNKSEITEESEPVVINEVIIDHSKQIEVTDAYVDDGWIRENLSEILVKEEHGAELKQSEDIPKSEHEPPHDPIAKFSFWLLILGILFVISEQFVDPTHPTIGVLGAILIFLSFILALISISRNKKREKPANTLFAKIVMYAFVVGVLGLIIAGIGVMFSDQMFSKY